jgi:hypothetical protein
MPHQEPKITINETPEAPPQSPKLLIPALTGLVCLLIGAGGVLAYQKFVQNPVVPPITATPVSTLVVATPTQPVSQVPADWKAYTNEQYSYSFKYPPTLTVEDEGGVQNYEDRLSINLTPGNSNPSAAFTIGPVGRIPKSSISSVAIDYQDPSVSLGSPNTKYSNIQTVNLNGLEAKTYDSHICFSGDTQCIKNVYYVVSDGKYVYLIVAVFDTDSSEHLIIPEQLQLFDQILSTFRFSDSINVSVSPTPGSLRQITYQPTTGWVKYSSATGYSIYHPDSFILTADKEKLISGSCDVFFSNNAGGVLSAHIVAYNGGALRELIANSYSDSSYKYSFEEVLIGGKKSLIMEKGPKTESGSGVFVVIPSGKWALVLTWENRDKSSDEVISLLQSISFTYPLDQSKCGQGN